MLKIQIIKFLNIFEARKFKIKLNFNVIIYNKVISIITNILTSEYYFKFTNFNINIFD